MHLTKKSFQARSLLRHRTHVHMVCMSAESLPKSSVHTLCAPRDGTTSSKTYFVEVTQSYQIISKLFESFIFTMGL